MDQRDRSGKAPLLVTPRDNVTPVMRDTDGTLGGFRTEHWDDRVDAVAIPVETIRLPIMMSREEADIVLAVNKEKRNG